MEFHPDMGYEENGVDLTNVDLYKPTHLPFGQATILPLFSYQSKIYCDLEDEKLWTRNWIAIGSTNEIPNVGDLLPYTVGHHGIHVQRENDDSLIGRFNKAQHGGCRAVPAQCQTGKKTKCSFTSCGYSRDQHVIRVEEIGENTPTMHQYLGLIPERLLPVQVATLGSFIFINLNQECNRLSDSTFNLPESIKSFLSSNITLQNSEWFECTSNWKLAGRAFFNGLNTSNHNPNTWDINDVSNTFSATSLSIHEIGINTENNIDNIEVCWIFPNLILFVHHTFIVSVILQPTSMSECILRTAIFKNNNNSTENTHIPSLTEWQEYMSVITRKAQSMQKQTDKLTAPGAPELTDNMIPVETSIAGYEFHRYISKQIETKHDYYWNAPLYSNKIIR